jgi:hypothetical protein
LDPARTTNHDKFLEQRIEELEQQVAVYEAFLNELPSLFGPQVPRTLGTHSEAIPTALRTTNEERTIG